MAGRRRGMRRLPACACLALAIGCSAWREEPASPSTLPAARMSPDTVVLEIFTLDAAGELGPLHEATWRQLDEQHLPAETRLRLSANGIRCGHCGLQLPMALLD